MRDDVKELLRAAITDIADLTRPLADVADDPSRLYAFFTRFGWSLDGLLGGNTQPLVSALAQVRSALAAAEQAADAASLATAVADLIAATEGAVRLAHERLGTLRDDLLAGTIGNCDPDVAKALLDDLVEYLCLTALHQRAPTLFGLAVLLGLIDEEEAAPLFAGGATTGQQLRFPIRRARVRLARLLALRGDALAAVVAAASAGGTSGPQSTLASFVQPLVERLGEAAARGGSRGLDGLVLGVDLDGIELRGLQLPLLEESAPPVAIPLPTIGDFAPVFTVGPHSLRLGWSGPGGAAPAEVVLFEEAGFAVSVLAAASAGALERGLTLSQPGGDLKLQLAGGLGLRLPLAALNLDGATATGSATGRLTLSLAADPSLEIVEAKVALANVSLGGPGGVVLERAAITVRGLVFPLPADPLAGVTVAVEGALALGAAGAEASLSATLGGGAFHVESSGEIQLGEGIRLHALAGTPVLVGDLVFGATPSFTLAVRGAIDIPVDGGTASVELGGSLALRQAGVMIEVVSFSAHGAASGPGPGGAWLLPGAIAVSGAHVDLAYDSIARRFSVTLGGHVEAGDGADFHAGGTLAATLRFAPGDPGDIGLDATLADARLELGGQLRVFDLSLALSIATRPAPHGSLSLTDGSGGLFLREGASGASVDDYFLSVVGAGAELVVDPAGLTLTLSHGELRLPAEVFSVDPTAVGAAAPSIDLGNGRTLVVRATAGGDLSFSGRLGLSDFGLAAQSSGAGLSAQARLDSATLVFDRDLLPAIEDAAGSIKIPLPDARVLEIDFSDVDWDLAGLPTSGTIALGQDLHLPLGGGFELVFLGAPGDPETSLAVQRVGGRVHYVLSAAAALTIPVSMLSGFDGEAVTASARAVLTAADLGQPPQLQVPWMRLEIAPDAQNRKIVHLGGQQGGAGKGLALEDASIEARNVDALFDSGAPSTGRFQLIVTGKLDIPLGADGGADVDTISLRLRGARFDFRGVELPDFNFDGLGFEANAAEGGLLSELPIRITQADIDTQDSSRPLPQKLYPDNIVITLGAELTIPIGDSASAGAGIDGFQVWLDANGFPHAALDGVQIGVDNLEVPGLGAVSGKVGVRNLSDPKNILFVGKLGGSVSGMGVSVLAAFRLRKVVGIPLFQPLGFCIDVSGGPAGIPLGQTGILINGASGGVSFANTNGSPCDFKTYYGIDDDGEVSGSGHAPAPRSGGGAHELPAGKRASHVGCPECPPRAMNILCQPHPAFRDRAILKFSSLDEPFLERIGIRPSLPICQLQASALTQAGLDTILEMLGAAVGELLPVPAQPLYPAPPPWHGSEAGEPNPFVEPYGYWRFHAERLILGAAQEVTDGRTVYDVVREVAYAGLPCPDATLQVTGTVSYTGISAFASITGGVTVSTAGSVGIMGWVTVVGLRIGIARAFLTLTDASGNPDPSICGDVKLAFGPLDFGQVGFTWRILGSADSLMQALVDNAQTLGAVVVDDMLGLVAAGIRDAPGYDPSRPQDALARLSRSEAAGFVMRLPERHGDAAREALVGILRTLLTSLDPRIDFCGRIAPRLCGIALANDLVAFDARISRAELIGSLRFSPIGVLLASDPRMALLASLFAIDNAQLSLRLTWPDPGDAVFAALTGRFGSEDAVRDYLESSLERMLQTAAFTVAYDLSPLGMRLVDAVGRLVMPYLAPPLGHPEFGHWWTNPDAGAGPSRLEVLEAALAGHMLGDVRWEGDLAQLPLGENTPPDGQKFLQRDYFPHGGMLGAGSLKLPRALVDPIPADLPKVFDPTASPVERIGPAINYVTNYLTKLAQLGSLAFYAPSPQPPLFTTPDGSRTLGPRELVDSLVALRFDATQLTASPLIRSELAFLRGRIEGRLLGVPVGEATIEAIADPPHFLVTADVEGNSWLAQFVPTATLRFELSGRPDATGVVRGPSLPLDVLFAPFAASLTAAKASGDAAIDAALNDLLDAMARELPRASLLASVDNFSMPAPLSRWLSADAAMELHAYSPAFDPNAPGTDPVAVARRHGGIVFAASVGFSFGAGGPTVGPVSVALTVLPDPDAPTTLPRLVGECSIGRVELGTGLVLHDASIRIDSRPDADAPVLALAGRLVAFRLGRFEVVPLSGDSIGATLELRLDSNDQPVARLVVDPARVLLPLLPRETVLGIHGEREIDPFVLATRGDWSAGLSLAGDLLVQSPVDPSDPPLLRATAAHIGGSIGRSGSRPVTLRLDVVEATLTVFPGQGALELELRQRELSITAKADGSFSVAFTVEPLRLGPAVLLHGPAGAGDPLRVKVTPYGLSIPRGARLSLLGPGIVDLRLRTFVINGNGDFHVTATARTLRLPGWFRFVARTIAIRREHGVVEVALRGASIGLGLFPASPFATPLQLVPTPAPAAAASAEFEIVVDSHGHFRYEGEQAWSLGRKLAVAGQLALGYDGAVFARLTGTLTAPPLPTLTASFELSPDRIALGAVEFRVPGLLELQDPSWSFERGAAGGASLVATFSAATVLGLPVAASRAEATVGEAGDWEVSVQQVGALALLPGWLELDAGSAWLAHRSGGDTLGLTGQAKALRSGGRWLVESGAGLQAGSGGLSLAVSGLTTLDLAALIAFLTAPPPASALPGWTVRIAWSSPSLDLSGGFSISAGGESSVSFSAESFGIVIAAGRLHFPSDWNVSSLGFPRIASSGTSLQAATSWSPGGDRAWHDIPGVPEGKFRISGPTLSIALDGTSVTVKITGGSIDVKHPLGSASASLPDVGLTVIDGAVGFDLPQLPTPSDKKRKLCRKAAHALVDPDLVDAAIAVCNANPPQLPSVSLRLSEVLA